jgi:hypothetical protein
VLGLLAPTLIAVAAALALGGSPRALVAARMRGWPLIVATFALELALYNPPIDRTSWAQVAGPWLWLATKVVLLVVLVWNAWPERRQVVWPLAVATCGVGLNALVIAANQGYMPQSPEAAAAVWGATRFDPTRLQNITPMRPETLLPWLGDIFPQPRWLPRPNVVSIGDILLALGVAGWAFIAALPNGCVTGTVRKRIVGVIRLRLHGPAQRPQRGSI